MKQPYKRTRIVCTIGPASRSVSTLTSMIRAGMNVCRLNFSHGTYADHAQLIKNIRIAEKACGAVVTILQDLSGPKLRVGDMGNGVELVKGELTIFSSRARKGVIHVHYPRLEKDIKKGERILLDDGALEVIVEQVRSSGLSCRVVAGGTLLSHKGFNIPDSSLTTSSLTRKDIADVAFGLKQKVDCVALSFVRSAKDVKKLRAIITEQWQKKNGVPPAIIAKIEKPEALIDIEKIVKSVDGVMIARGDLGIETPLQSVPLEQKRIIALCRQQGKFTIVATEMLASMVAQPRPTRAEVSDVANAIIDHTDAIMLSGESATGAYPIDAVKIMASVARETEASLYDDIGICQTQELTIKTHRQVGALVSVCAQRGDVKCVIIPPDAVSLIPQIAFFRPEVPLIVGCADMRTARQLQVYWGIYVLPVRVASPHTFMRELGKRLKSFEIKRSDQIAMIHQGVKSFDLFVGRVSDIAG